MAVRDITGSGPRVSHWQKLVGRLSRYDLVLAAIPLVFGLAMVVALVTPLPSQAAIAGGAVVAAGLLTDALYLNPPAPPRGENESTADERRSTAAVADD